MDIKLTHKTLGTVMDKITESVYEIYTNRLIACCPELLNEIYKNGNNWYSDLYNLRDSFAWGLYRDGSLIAKGFYEEESSIEPKKIRGTFKTVDGDSVVDFPDELSGRESIEIFFSNYEPDTSYKFEIVLVAGMFYAHFLQEMGRLEGFELAYADMKTNLKNVFKSKRSIYYSRPQ